MTEEKTKYEVLIEVLNKMVEEEKLPKNIVEECIAYAEKNGVDDPGEKENDPKKVLRRNKKKKQLKI